MNKFQIVKQLRKNGDSIISGPTLLDGILVTLDFSEKYIRKQRSKRFVILKDCILLYSWTENKLRQVKVQDIRSIIPLSSILRNPPPEIIDGFK